VFCIGAVVLYLAIKLTGKSMNKYTAIIKISYFWIDLGVVFGFISLLLNIILKNIPSKLPKNEGNQSSQLIKDKE
jgi:predicted membrane protein